MDQIQWIRILPQFKLGVAFRPKILVQRFNRVACPCVTLDFEGGTSEAARPPVANGAVAEAREQARRARKASAEARRASERRGEASEARQGERLRRGKAGDARRASRRGAQGDARHASISEPMEVEVR